MSDGGLLILTVSTMADRSKTLFGDRTAPDEQIADTAQVVLRAVQFDAAVGQACSGAKSKDGRLRCRR